MSELILVSGLLRKIWLSFLFVCFFFKNILTMQDKHNTSTLWLFVKKIKLMCTHCKTCQKTLLFYLILPLIQMNIIFSDNINIVYVFQFISRILINNNIDKKSFNYNCYNFVILMFLIKLHFLGIFFYDFTVIKIVHW